MDWDTMRARLHAVTGFGGEANKAKRKAWIATALGLKGAPPKDLFGAYARAGAEQQLHVARCLEELERAGAALDAFDHPGRLGVAS